MVTLTIAQKEKAKKLTDKAKLKANQLAVKAKEQAKKVGKTAIENPKETGYIVGGIALLIGVIYLGNKLIKRVDSFFDGDPNIEDQIGLDLRIKNPTISSDMATNFASQLLDAMNDKAPFYGTNEKLVEAVFDKLKNGDDFKRVASKFGLKDYNGYNSPPTGVFSNFDSYELRNLIYWLIKEIHPVTDRSLYNKIKSRVESAGLVFA
ncbi:hypothetical protein [Dokdonia sp.]|uniref:hypothetical protein n=1 Tax=Dokdonia sp. TaxID=2024995 RepID=UPI003264EC70